MKRHARYIRLDEIRGLTLVSMILYHFLWDLVYIAGLDIPWYRGLPGYFWQQSICWTFILLSGFCWSLGSRRLKRGLTVFGAGMLVTAVTLVFLPDARILFGVLTLLGSSMLLLIPLDRLFAHIKKRVFLICALGAALLCFCLFKRVNSGYIPPFAIAGRRLVLPTWLYSGWLSTYLGFPMRGFYSTDYFSLIPWFFLFLSGYFCFRILFFPEKNSEKAPESASSPQPPAGILKFLRTAAIPWACVLGRHSLLVYLLHQPFLYAVTLLILRITKP